MNDKEKPDNRTYVQRRHAERREVMREFLSAQKYIEKIENDLNRDLAPEELPVVKFKTETRLKLLAKILPDVIENKLTGDPDSPVITERIERHIVDPQDTDAKGL